MVMHQNLFDVLAALADPKRSEPGENYWTYVDTALDAHESGASAIKVKIAADGTWSQEVFSFGGNSGAGARPVKTVEKITPTSAAIPTSEELPSPQEIIQTSFGFAEELLKAQREFAENVLAAASPAFEPKPKKA